MGRERWGKMGGTARERGREGGIRGRYSIRNKEGRGEGRGRV